MDTSTADLNALKAALANSGGEHLGDMCWWRLAGADIMRSVLEIAWSANGLDPKFLPEAQTPEKALRLAVRNAGSGTSNKAGMLIRPTLNNTATLMFAVVREIPDAVGNYVSQQTALVMLDRATGKISTDNASDETACGIVKEFTMFLTTHPARDVMSSMVKALHAWKAVTLRDGGGVYWVPRTMSDNVRALKRAVETIGGSHVTVLPVNDTAEGRSELAMAAQGSIEADLGALRQEIDGFLATPEGVRCSTLEHRLEAFDELRSRASLYQSILSVTVTDLTDQLAAMEQQISTLLASKATE